MSRRTAYILLFLLAVFVAALSQLLLKKAALRQYRTPWQEDLNPLVIVAYGCFFLATAVDVIAYREVPLSLGPILEATSYIYVTIFGALCFHEKITANKLRALFLILLGIAVFAVFG